MGTPLAQDTTTICTEAYNLVGIASPTAAQVTRATNYFLEQVKNDIWSRAGASGDTRLKSLQMQRILISKIGISTYQLTTDFSDDISVSLLTGTTPRGINSAGTVSATVTTLSSCEDNAVDDVEGKYLFITASSTGAETELHQITDYSTATFQATLDSSFGVQPAATDTYVIINDETVLDEDTILDQTEWRFFDKSTPSDYLIVREAGVENMMFNRPFPNSYTGILLRYYADINRLNTTSTLMNEIYQTWKNPLILGVASKIAFSEDDNRYDGLKGDYEQAVNNLLNKELPYSGVWEGFEV